MMEVITKHLTTHRMTNQISMDSNFKGKYLLLEGVKDVKVYLKHFKENNLKTLICHGKYNQRIVWEDLNQRNESRIIAIRDADFIRLRGKLAHDYHHSFFLTDSHDSEIMMVNSGLFMQSLQQALTITKYQDILDTRPNLLSDLKNLIYPLGCLKLANKLDSLGLKFKPSEETGTKIDFNKFIDIKKMQSLGNDKIIQTCINYSMNKVTKGSISPVEEIQSSLKQVLKQNHPIDEIIHGHDFSMILALFVKKHLGVNNDHLKNDDNTETFLAACFDSKFFKTTQLYQTINNWEKSNIFQLLDI